MDAGEQLAALDVAEDMPRFVFAEVRKADSSPAQSHKWGHESQSVRGPVSDVQPMDKQMKYIQICASSDGDSYFADGTWLVFEADITPPSPAGYSVTETMAATGVLMMHHPAGYRDEWHCAPAPVVGTVLTGSVRITTSDGDIRVLSPGDQFVATDLTGSGHRMEEVNGGAYDLALVVLDGLPENLPGEKPG